MAELSSRSGVPRETIHFYLREGLLPRPRKGGRTVAYYGEEHLDRLRIIRRLREEKYLPLAVIRRLLDTPATAARDVDVLAEVLDILPRDADPGPAPSAAAVREAAARGLLGARSPPGSPGDDPAERRILGLVDETLALDDPARALTLADLEACASGLEGLVAREAAIFFDAVLQSGDLEGSIAALRSGRGTVARFITAFRDLMLRRVLEELLLAAQQGHAAVMRSVVPPLSRARREALGEPARRDALAASAASALDARAAEALVIHLFGCADVVALAALSPAIAAAAGPRLAPLTAWGAHEAAPTNATLAELERAVGAAADLPLGPILLAGAMLARGVRPRDDAGPGLLESVVPALQRLAAADPESEANPTLRALGCFHLGWIERALPAVLGRRERGALAVARALSILEESSPAIDAAVVATLLESAGRRD